MRKRHKDIADYAFSHLTVAKGDSLCLIQSNSQWVDYHSDGTYTVLRFSLECPINNAPLSLDYRLFFELDPWHRGLLKFVHSEGVESGIFSPERPRIELNPGQLNLWQTFIQYGWEGIWHIWVGFDHILFLLALLLPVVLWREKGQWQEVDSFRSALLNVIGVVTAFTFAHSITLSAAAFNFTNLPSRWVESTIAATVVLAALNNLYPLVHGKRWLIAFCLGLIHGFGFASVLADLGLPSGALSFALVGFNLGVEAGQLVIVVAFFPIAFILRSSWFYQLAVMRLGSLGVIVVGMVWLLERSLDIPILPI